MIPKYYEFFNKTKIMSGYRAMQNVPHELKVCGVERPFIITDLHADSKEIRSLLLVLKHAGFEVENIIGNIDDDFMNRFISGNYDSIVALGKNNAFMAATEVKSVHPVPFIAIPTLYSCTGTIGEPDIVVLDPHMTTSLTPMETVAISIEIICNAIEAYTCMQKNPLSDAYAFSAISLISENIKKVIKNKRDKNAALSLLNAGIMSGIAKANSPGGIVHTLSCVLEESFKIPYGEACGIILPHCMEQSMIMLDEYYGELLLPLAGAEVYADTMKTERGRKTIQYLNTLLKDYHKSYGLPLCLSEVGIKRSDFTDIISKCMVKNSLLYNPSEVREEELTNILNNAF